MNARPDPGDSCAHQILVMDAGRIVERGTHAKLLAAAGRYADMWAMQQQASERVMDEIGV